MCWATFTNSCPWSWCRPRAQLKLFLFKTIPRPSSGKNEKTYKIYQNLFNVRNTFSWLFIWHIILFSRHPALAFLKSFIKNALFQSRCKMDFYILCVKCPIETYDSSLFHTSLINCPTNSYPHCETHSPPPQWGPPSNTSDFLLSFPELWKHSAPLQQPSACTSKACDSVHLHKCPALYHTEKDL